MNILKQKAFTLIEIMVVVFIMVIVSLIVSEFLTTGFKSVKFNDEQEVAIEHAREAMDEMTKTIRGANYSAHGDYILSIINPQEIEFYADKDSDSVMEKVKYYIEGTELKMSITKLNSENIYDDSSATIKTIANYLNNQTEPLFKYYNSSSEITSIINEIRSVRIYLKINVTPTRAPGDYILESDVELRNLKDN